MNSTEPNGARALAIEYRATTTLKANPRNARTHSKRQVRAIAESIRQFDFANPILLDEDDIILAGHGRYAAAKLLGLEKVPTICIADMSPAEKRAFVLADNKLAERAGWDRATLALELGDLSVMLPEIGLSPELTGFEAGEIDLILGDAEEEKAASADDEQVAIPETPVSRLGDLYELGRHRLLCGDARDESAVGRLMAGELADLTFTDPPYDLSISKIGGKGRIQHAEFAMASGEMSSEEFTTFLHGPLRNIANVSRDGAFVLVCMDWRHFVELHTAARGVFSELKNLIVWEKSNAGMGSLYRSAHELIALFKVGSGDHVNNVELGRFERNRTNVWHYPGISGFKADRMQELSWHPTVKPVALVADAIKDVTRRGGIVLDLFGGSGTTLIAAERTGRRARLLEFEPRYVDVTIRRFERLTGSDVIHRESGATFTELAQSRATAVSG